MKNPEWMHTYGAKYNKALKGADGDSVKGWVVPSKLRAEFIEWLNKREGLKQKLKSSGVAAVVAVVDTDEPPRSMVEAKLAPQQPKIKAALRSRVKQTVSADEFTVALDNLSVIVAPFMKDTFHERCADDKLYLSSNSSTLLRCQSRNIRRGMGRNTVGRDN